MNKHDMEITGILLLMMTSIGSMLVVAIFKDNIVGFIDSILSQEMQIAILKQMVLTAWLSMLILGIIFLVLSRRK